MRAAAANPEATMWRRIPRPIPRREPAPRERFHAVAGRDIGFSAQTAARMSELRNELADQPHVTERVDDGALQQARERARARHREAMLADRTAVRRTGGDRARVHRGRIVDEQLDAHGREAGGRARAVLRRFVCEEQRRAADVEPGDDVAVVLDLPRHGRTERALVERNRGVAVGNREHRRDHRCCLVAAAIPSATQIWLDACGIVLHVMMRDAPADTSSASTASANTAWIAMHTGAFEPAVRSWRVASTIVLPVDTISSITTGGW